jgi:hypothetical protein
MLIGKPNAPLEPNCFSISPDLTAMAFATKDGILLFKSKNLITESCKDTLIIEKQPLKYIKFHYDPTTLIVGLYAVSSSTVQCISNVHKDQPKRKIGQQGSFKLYDVNEKGELIVVAENNQILSFNMTNDKVNAWPYDEDKLVLHF